MAMDSKGYLVIDVSGTPYTLTGKMGDSGIQVSYHAESLETSADLGTIDAILDSIIDAVGKAFGLTGTPFPKWSTIKADIQKIPAVGPVIDRFAKAHLRITDLGINTVTSTYEFGFAFDFKAGDQQEVKISEIVLDAFGWRLTYTKPGKS